MLLLNQRLRQLNCIAHFTIQLQKRWSLRQEEALLVAAASFVKQRKANTNQLYDVIEIKFIKN